VKKGFDVLEEGAPLEAAVHRYTLKAAMEVARALADRGRPALVHCGVCDSTVRWERDNAKAPPPAETPAVQDILKEVEARRAEARALLEKAEEEAFYKALTRIGRKVQARERIREALHLEEAAQDYLSQDPEAEPQSIHQIATAWLASEEALEALVKAHQEEDRKTVAPEVLAARRAALEAKQAQGPEEDEPTDPGSDTLRSSVTRIH
jgi:hypothetical protein